MEGPLEHYAGGTATHERDGLEVLDELCHLVACARQESARSLEGRELSDVFVSMMERLRLSRDELMKVWTLLLLGSEAARRCYEKSADLERMSQPDRSLIG